MGHSALILRRHTVLWFSSYSFPVAVSLGQTAFGVFLLTCQTAPQTPSIPPPFSFIPHRTTFLTQSPPPTVFSIDIQPNPIPSILSPMSFSSFSSLNPISPRYIFFSSLKFKAVLDFYLPIASLEKSHYISTATEFRPCSRLLILSYKAYTLFRLATCIHSPFVSLHSGHESSIY